jgi:hypothetical protein
MWMDVDGCGWMWMDVDGCGWMWMDVGGPLVLQPCHARTHQEVSSMRRHAVTTMKAHHKTRPLVVHMSHSVVTQYRPYMVTYMSCTTR